MTESGKDQFQIRFSGSSIYPETVSSRELGDILAATEEMIAVTINQVDPKINSRDVIVGLTAIRTESLGLVFTLQQSDIVVPAISKVTDAVNSGNYLGLRDKAIKGLQRIVKFTEKYKCKAEFIGVGKKRDVVATISPSTVISIPASIHGQTTIYGKLMRVGGSEPKARIQTIQGKTISCSMSEQLAQELGSRLYTQIGLNGTAEWAHDLSEIISFKASSICPYRHKSTVDSFNELRKLFGDSFAGKTAKEHMIAIRGE